MEELWKDIPQYEGLYQVSNYGRVKSVKTGKIKCQSSKPNGYQFLQLYKNNKPKNEYVHRLVAMAFIPNPDKLPQVNHKDEDKANNFVDNLEWCDNSYNQKYHNKQKRSAETLKLECKTSIQIIKCDMDGNELEYYNSMREAERENGLANGAVSAYFRFNRKQTGGFTWKKLED